MQFFKDIHHELAPTIPKILSVIPIQVWPVIPTGKWRDPTEQVHAITLALAFLVYTNLGVHFHYTNFLVQDCLARLENLMKTIKLNKSIS